MSWRNVNTAFLALCAISEVHSGPRGSRFQLSAGRTQPTTATKTQAVVKLALLRQSPSAPLSVIGNLFSIFNARKQPREEIKLNCIKKRTKGKEKRTLVRTLHFCKRWWVLATTCFFLYPLCYLNIAENIYAENWTYFSLMEMEPWPRNCWSRDRFLNTPLQLFC